MAEVVLFHHIQGLTEGVRAFAQRLRDGGHTVHTPDLFDGATAASVEAGSDLADGIGHEELVARAARAVDPLPAALVFAGTSFGAATAQRLAQQRPGARGALLYEGCLPISGEWAVGPWPDDVSVQIHGADKDPYFALEGDIDSAREIVAAVGPARGELFIYPGDVHLFTDNSLPSYDPAATGLVIERSLAFLGRLG